LLCFEICGLFNSLDWRSELITWPQRCPGVEMCRKTLSDRRKVVNFVACRRDLRCCYDSPSGHASS